MPLHYLPYARHGIDTADIHAVTEALKSPTITRGIQVDNFERQFADYCTAQFAVAFNSGSTALQAACYAAKVDCADRVISTPNTFIATVGAAVQAGAEPLFVDIDWENGQMNLEQVSDAMDQRYSRGRTIIMPMHFAGMTIDMVELEQTIKDPDCVVIEDGCHALGSHYPSGQKVGSCAYSQMTIFSFHPAKMITTGEGGMVTTNDLDLYKRLRLFRNNGIERDPHHLGHIQKPWEYDVQELSSNYNFTDFQAALGSSQLSRINALIDKRHHLVATYRRLLRDKPHIHQLSGLCDNHTAFHLFTIHVDFKACGTTRDAVMQRLHARQIGSQLHYIPVYRHQAFKRRCGDISSLFPVMEKHYQQALSLPLYPELTDADIARVVNELCLALGKQ